MNMKPVYPVLLVGAGPGDPELLTIKAVRAIAQADVILVDDLVNCAVLDHARQGVRIRWVGKRGGCRSTPQAFIERLMVREARAGHRVVRLKGGDPLIFGRAGEEIAALREAGLEVQIINGITSALAAAAALGISLTHRRHSHGVVFVTGHPQGDGSALDWAALAHAGITLAIYMGVTRATDIQQALLAGGLDPGLPAAVVQHASGEQQAHLLTTLGALAGDLARSQLRSPALLLVGKVAGEAAAAGAGTAAAAEAGKAAAGAGDQTTAISSFDSSDTTRLRPSVLAL